jgi:hypothetical protein
MPELKILSAVFGEQWLEVQYTDESWNTDDVVDVRNRLIQPGLFDAEITEILERLVDILDKADVHRRNPAQNFRRVSTPSLDGDQRKDD